MAELAASPGAAAGVVLGADLPRILNMTVPHVGHLPLMARRPFFITSSTASTISFLALHLTQYPSTIITHFLSGTPIALPALGLTYGLPILSVNS